MKKLLLTLTLVLTAFCGMAIVNAEEVNLKDIETNTYIIGNRIYELTNYGISIFDVVDATDEFKSIPGNENAKVPLYFYGGYNSCVEEDGEDCSLEGTYLKEITGPGSDDFIKLETEEVFADGIMDATRINNKTVEEVAEEIEADLDAKLEELAEELNKTAADYDFESITYDAESKTGTFKIANLKASLANYKDSGIVDMFLAFIEDADEVTYYIGGEEVTVKVADLNNSTVINIAYALLADMAGDAEKLTYGSVAGKYATATVKIVRDGYACYETYNLYFEFDFEEFKDAKDVELDTLAKELNKTAADYDFESITYDAETRTGTFKIANLKASLAGYKDSGIVDMFLEFIKDADEVTYYIGGEEVTVKVADLNNSTVINIAYALLADMAGDAEELTYGAVAGATATATVTYYVGENVYSEYYNLYFEFDLEKFNEEKNVELDTLAKELNKTAAEYDFESITYDAETRTGTFKIANLKASLAGYKDSGIVDMFLEFIKDADEVTYYIGGEEVTVKVADLNNSTVINIAYALLADMAGDAEELTYGAVAGKYATAYVTYYVGGNAYNEYYNLYFEFDFEAFDDAKDLELDTLAKELNKTAADYDFESITYDAESKTGTFKIANLKASLAGYKDSGIVDMFLEFIKDADEVTYYIGGEEVTVKVADLNNSTVINIAYALLADMAGDAEELTYGAVAGKYATATVKYNTGEYPQYVTYTLYFEFDYAAFDEAKDVELDTLAKELNKTAADYDFESITYDAETRTGTFVIADDTADLASYKDSGIVDMFLEFIKDADEVTYYIGGEEVTVKVADLNNSTVINIAYALLADMAGDAEELTYGAVAGETATALVTYNIGGNIQQQTYTLSFKLAE